MEQFEEVAQALPGKIRDKADSLIQKGVSAESRMSIEEFSDLVIRYEKARTKVEQPSVEDSLDAYVGAKGANPKIFFLITPNPTFAVKHLNQRFEDFIRVFSNFGCGSCFNRYEALYYIRKSYRSCIIIISENEDASFTPITEDLFIKMQQWRYNPEVDCPHNGQVYSTYRNLEHFLKNVKQNAGNSEDSELFIHSDFYSISA